MSLGNYSSILFKERSLGKVINLNRGDIDTNMFL